MNASGSTQSHTIADEALLTLLPAAPHADTPGCCLETHFLARAAFFASMILVERLRTPTERRCLATVFLGRAAFICSVTLIDRLHTQKDNRRNFTRWGTPSALAVKMFLATLVLFKVSAK